jgi:hypothetical protein
MGWDLVGAASLRTVWVWQYILSVVVLSSCRCVFHLKPCLHRPPPHTRRNLNRLALTSFRACFCLHVGSTNKGKGFSHRTQYCTKYHFYCSPSNHYYTPLHASMSRALIINLITHCDFFFLWERSGAPRRRYCHVRLVVIA